MRDKQEGRNTMRASAMCGARTGRVDDCGLSDCLNTRDTSESSRTNVVEKSAQLRSTTQSSRAIRSTTGTAVKC